MKIRTITQLPMASRTLNLSAYFHVAEPKTSEDPNSPTAYVSKKQSYLNIKNQLEDDISSSIVGTFHLKNSSDQPINVADLSTAVDRLYNSGVTINGKKSFSTAPVTTYDYNTTEDEMKNMFATVGYVKETIIPSITYNHISPTSTYDAARTADGFYNEGNLYRWSIDSGEQESGVQTFTKPGNLVMYGWLADNGEVDARTAWVGIFGVVDGREICLGMRPWIVGQKSTVMQYVGFNIPVAKNLTIKVRTGFPVDGSNSMSQGKDSAAFGINTVNTFVGYVIS